MNAEVVLVGEGHGAHAALEGLEAAFERIEIVSDDSRLRWSGHRHVASLSVSDAPLAILAGSRTILEATEFAARPVFNIHPSLLPEYRGRHSVVWAMLDGRDAVGISVHRVDAEIDNGPILYQHREEISAADTSRSLFARLNAAIARDLGSALRDWLSGTHALLSQDEARATWYPRRDLADCLIDFGQEHLYLSRLFRALVAPYPLPAFLCRRGRFEIVRHRLMARSHWAPPGRVVNRTADGAIYITTRDGYLIAETLRDEKGADHRAGAVLSMGERLG